MLGAHTRVLRVMWNDTADSAAGKIKSATEMMSRLYQQSSDTIWIRSADQRQRCGAA